MTRPELPPGWEVYELHDLPGRFGVSFHGEALDTIAGSRQAAINIAWEREHESECPDPWVAWADHETERAERLHERLHEREKGDGACD